MCLRKFRSSQYANEVNSQPEQDLGNVVYVLWLKYLSVGLTTSEPASDCLVFAVTSVSASFRLHELEHFNS